LLILLTFLCKRLRELVQELEGNEEDLVEEVGNIANERYSLGLKHQEKTREVEEMKFLLDEKSNQCHSCESENALLVGKLSTYERIESDLVQ
jgi:hypothetical protein